VWFLVIAWVNELLVLGVVDYVDRAFIFVSGRLRQLIDIISGHSESRQTQICHDNRKDTILVSERLSLADSKTVTLRLS
jgi:hypothetical protein